MPWPVKPQPLYLQPSADFQPTGSKNLLSLDCEPGPGQGTKKMHKAQPCTGSQKKGSVECKSWAMDKAKGAGPGILESELIA